MRRSVRNGREVKGGNGGNGCEEVRRGWTEREETQPMLSWGKRVLEKKLECKSFLSYVFKDACFPPKCNDRKKDQDTFLPYLTPFHADSL